MALLPALPFWLHLVIETPAALNFFISPSEQLSTAAPQAHAIIKQYAVLLFASNLIALTFALRPVDSTGKLVGAALALYHLAPLLRATTRISKGEASYGKALGGPWVHLAVHGACFVGFMRLLLL